MPDFEWRGHTVYFERKGSGEPVLMVHAMSVSGKYWRKVADALEGTYDLLIPDLPYHGRTGDLPNAEGHSHNDNADLLRLLIETTHDGPVHIVGHSYGGASALSLMHQSPELVDRSVLIEPSIPTVLNEAGEIELFAEFLELSERFNRLVSAGEREKAWQAYVDSQNADGTWEKMPAEKKQQILATTNQAYAVGRATLGNTLKLTDLGSIQSRTTMVVGDQSPIRHRRTAEIVRDHIPECAMTVIPGASHMSPGSHPDDIAAVIDQHFK